MAGWVVGGNYLDWQQDISWPLAEIVVWLDFELRGRMTRAVRRSWRRYRSRELLWGTNYEDFWTHLKLWDREKSLLSWAVSTHRPNRRRNAAFINDPCWAHIRFVRLCTPAAVERWVARLVRPLPLFQLQRRIIVFSPDLLHLAQPVGPVDLG